MEVEGPHGSVVGGGMVFGEVICEVAFTFAPINLELILSHSVSYPIEAHVNGFGPLLFYRVIDDSLCT